MNDDDDQTVEEDGDGSSDDSDSEDELELEGFTYDGTDYGRDDDNNVYTSRAKVGKISKLP